MAVFSNHEDQLTRIESPLKTFKVPFRPVKKLIGSSNNLKKKALLCLLVFSMAIWFLCETTLKDLIFQSSLPAKSILAKPRPNDTYSANAYTTFARKDATNPIPSIFSNSTCNTFLYNYILSYNRTTTATRNASIFAESSALPNGYLVSGPGCNIPALDPYDPSISPALAEYEAPPNCGIKWNNILVRSNLTHIYIDKDVKLTLNYSDNLTCCVRPFWVPKNPEEGTYKYHEKCIPFKNAITVEAVEFVRVECSDQDFLVYKDFFSFIPDAYIAQAKNLSPQRSVSVLVLGLDALSRLNFRRQMKRMHSFLINKIKGIEFFGFHKVGDNTFPNLIPLLSGKSVEELTKSCWPDKNSTFDNCSFIWDNFKEEDFVTGFGEDASWMGLFEYCKMGFIENPTDVYLRVFNYLYEKELGHDLRLNARLCAGPKMNVEVLLDSISKFVLRLKGKLSFGFFWENSLSHDYLNLPHYGDEIHTDFLKNFLDSGIFEESVVFIVSDHGLRWGKIRTTYQGYLEERLPLLIISCPKWFRKRFHLAWRNLKKNSRRLTTPFDIYETLKDLVKLTHLTNNNIFMRSKDLEGISSKKFPRGISLFLPITEKRSCEDADISEHWCTCNKDISFPVNSTCITKSAQFIIEQINFKLKTFEQCSKLHLLSIKSARYKFLDSNKVISQPVTSDQVYTVMIEASPGGGLFEATVEHNSEEDKFSLKGSISRSNTYGNSSYCISNYELKLYCYCITLLTNKHV